MDKRQVDGDIALTIRRGGRRGGTRGVQSGGLGGDAVKDKDLQVQEEERRRERRAYTIR